MPSASNKDLQLVRPEFQHLASYVEALQQGWSADTIRGEVAAREELELIAHNARRFLASLDDPEARGGPITLPDGSLALRLPGFRRWMWDGELCGSIGFRWQKGTPELPAHVSLSPTILRTCRPNRSSKRQVACWLNDTPNSKRLAAEMAFDLPNNNSSSVT